MAFLSFFNRKPQQAYCIIARFSVGSFMKRFEVEAASPYEACRKFDTDPQFAEYIRVSGATIPNEF